MKKQCYRCKALVKSADGSYYECLLNHAMDFDGPAHSTKRNPLYYKPLEECDKPTTYKQLALLSDVDVPRKLKPDFGDVLFRPNNCYTDISVSVIASIVNSVYEENGVTHVVSTDVFGHAWDDNLEDIGVTVFKTKYAAQRHLHGGE